MKITKVEEISEIEIGELFNIFKEYSSNIDNLGDEKYVIENPFKDVESLSFNKETRQAEYKPLKYVMGHNTEKDLYTFLIKDKEITVTEDHSCIVERGDEIIDIKPRDIKFGDKFILYTEKGIEFIDKFSVVKNNRKEYVYDIEVEDNHNFFGNDILVHNSFYIKFDKYVDSLLEKEYQGRSYMELNEDERKELVNKLVNFINDEIQPIVDESVAYIQKKFNAYQKGFMGAKIEKIGLSGLWTAKKRYALLKLWDEGSFFLDTKLAVTGIETVKSSTPDFSIEKLTEALTIILSKDEEYLRNFIKETKKEFIKVAKENPSAVATNSRVNNITKYLKDNKGWYFINEDGRRIGCPMNSKGTIIHNQLLVDLGINHIQPIEPGSKVYIIKLKKPNKYNIDVIAFQDESLLFDTGLVDAIDVEEMWNVGFISPLKIITDAIDWELVKKNKIDLSGW